MTPETTKQIENKIDGLLLIIGFGGFAGCQFVYAFQYPQFWSYFTMAGVVTLLILVGFLLELIETSRENFKGK